MNFAGSIISEISASDANELAGFMRVLGVQDRDFQAVDRILGYASKGRTSERWLTIGIPPAAHTLMAYISTYGSEIAEMIAQRRDRIVAEAKAGITEIKTTRSGNRYKPNPRVAMVFKVSPDEVANWRQRHAQTQAELDRIFGLTSKGRSCRLWEESGAPGYAEVFMAYADEHGLDLAEAMLKLRGQEISRKARSKNK